MNKANLIVKYFPLLLFFFQPTAWAQSFAVDGPSSGSSSITITVTGVVQ